MRIGLAIGPLKFWIQIGERPRRRRPTVSNLKPPEEPRRTTSRINEVRAPALKLEPPPLLEISPLQAQARADAMSALVALGYNKRIARERVNAVPITNTSTTEQILRAALRGTHVSTN
jgi:hypothetical protein